jgi:hypothetical protein
MAAASELRMGCDESKPTIPFMLLRVEWEAIAII